MTLLRTWWIIAIRCEIKNKLNNKIVAVIIIIVRIHYKNDNNKINDNKNDNIANDNNNNYNRNNNKYINNNYLVCAYDIYCDLFHN